MTHQEALLKAAKLLRLSKSPVPAEAALAMSKAQEIIDRFQLDVESLDFDKRQEEKDAEQVKDFGYEDPLDHVKDRVYQTIWKLKLSNFVARVNSCRICWYAQLNRSRVIKIIGRPSDVTTVRYLYSFFAQQVEELAKANCAGNSNTYIGHFCIGVVDSIREKLNAQRKQTFEDKRNELGANPLALMRVNQAIAKMKKRDQDVEAFVRGNIHYAKARAHRSSFNAGGARAHGQQVGRASIRTTKAGAGIGSGTKSIGN
jgi:hypothetical protein